MHTEHGDINVLADWLGDEYAAKQLRLQEISEMMPYEL